MIRKIFPYILIAFIILVGFFSLARPANAEIVNCTSTSDTTPGCLIACTTAVARTGNSGRNTITIPQCTAFNTPPGIVATMQVIGSAGDVNSSTTGEPGLNLGCNSAFSISLSTCVAQLSYIIFSVSSAVTAVAGRFLDFFVYYSTNSASYTNQFIEKGWVAVRDVANIFFIVALLYIAIKIVLDLNASGSKKLIANVVIIALVINFSLFTTRIIIDASNILAKVFYNQITPETTNNSQVTGTSGEKSISLGIVNKFNPVSLISRPVYDVSPYSFIFMTLIISAILLYMTYMFFSVALLFVSRVVSLWISMIFAPLAFISYTVPFDIPGFGHKRWWDDLLKNAFLAPLFVFFLYIIALFTNFLKDIISYADNPNLTSTANLIQHLMSVIIPFAILMMLLAKAKKLAVEYSGAMGQAVMSVGKMVGGVALGAATGGLAIAGRASVGRIGNALANSEWAKERERQGGVGSTLFRNVTGGVGSASFDARAVKIGGKTLAGATGMNLGEAKKGGFIQGKKEQVEKRQQRAKELQVGENDPLKQALNKTEADLQGLLGTQAKEIETIDKLIEKKRQEAIDAERNLKAASTPAEVSAAKNKLKDANSELGNAKERKTALREGRWANYTAVGGIIPPPDNYTSAQVGGHGIDALEKQQKTDAQAIKTKNVLSNQAYAKAERSTGGRVKGFIFSGGTYTKAASEEAAHNIIMETKLDSGTKT